MLPLVNAGRNPLTMPPHAPETPKAATKLQRGSRGLANARAPTLSMQPKIQLGMRVASSLWNYKAVLAVLGLRRPATPRCLGMPEVAAGWEEMGRGGAVGAGAGGKWQDRAARPRPRLPHTPQPPPRPSVRPSASQPRARTTGGRGASKHPAPPPPPACVRRVPCRGLAAPPLVAEKGPGRKRGQSDRRCQNTS
jgi:hypothetical protein